MRKRIDKSKLKLMKKISVVIICKNEEKNIEECLKSVQWCDEIVLIDGFSVDRTIEIAKTFNIKIFQNEWKGFSDQRKFALTKVHNEWVFSLDADERCSNELAEEIKNIFSQNNFAEKGFLIPRKSFFLGKWIKHCGWYPDFQLRLFNKNSVTVKERLVHESYEVQGECGELSNVILHFTVKSISEFVTKINHYSSLSSIEKVSVEKIGYTHIFLKPFLEFIKKFIFQKGFMDGINGLMVSYFHMMTKILTYMKMREIQKQNS